MMRTLRIYSLNNFPIIYSNVNCIYCIMHYIPSIYLSYNWKFLPFDCLHPIKTSPPPVITNLISFSMNMFVFEVLSTYDTVLVPVTQHSDLIFLTFQNDHGKSSYHLLPYKDIVYLLIVLPTMYISYQ